MKVRRLHFTSLTEKQIAKFWQKVQKGNSDQCWPWIRAKTPTDQGKLTINKKTHLACRVGWFIVHKEDPYPLHVLHKCDFKLCCNPSHWFKGTNHENILDRNRKDRGGRKLTTSDVVDILARLKCTTNTKERESIAKDFGVTPGMIMHIYYGRAWKHVNR